MNISCDYFVSLVVVCGEEGGAGSDIKCISCCRSIEKRENFESHWARWPFMILSGSKQ